LKLVMQKKYLLSIVATVCVLVVSAVAAVLMSDAYGENSGDRQKDRALVAQAQPRPKAAPAAPAQAPPPAPAQAAPSAPAQAAPAQAPVRTETVVYDNWTVSCVDSVDGSVKKTCSAKFQMFDQERKAVVFVWLIGRNPEGTLFSVMQTPTGVLVQKGVELKIGSGAARTMPFVFCGPQHCEASLPMDDALAKEMAAAQAVTATLFTPDGKALNFNLVPKGIDKAIASANR
jgi:invasion protein IalB